MKILFAILFILTPLADVSIAAAPNHLQPEDSLVILPLYGNDFSANVAKLTAYVDSKSPALVLSEVNGELSIVALEKNAAGNPQLHCVSCPLHKKWNVPADFAKVIPSAFASQIERLWWKELLKVSYGKADGSTVDGGEYHFAAFFNGRRLAGRATTVGDPKESPSLHNLLEIANLLYLYTKSGPKEESDWMSQLTKRVAGSLK